MLTLATLTIDSYDVDSLTLYWSWATTNEDLDDYVLDVYRSEHAGSNNSLNGYEVVASGISVEDDYYTDTSISGLAHPNRVWYYKLNLKNLVTEEESLLTASPLYRFYQTDDYAYNEILRRKRLAIDKFSGRDLYLLKKKTWGTRCTECWDEVLMRSNDPDCDVCHGTSWTGGYFDSIQFKAVLNTAPKYNQITMFGDWMPSDLMLTMLNFPILTIKDVVVDQKNVRWMVKAIRNIEKIGVVIEQQAQLSRISEGDEIYKVEV